MFSWHKNPRRNVKPLKYLTKEELIQSCARISVPKASLLITEDLGGMEMNRERRIFLGLSMLDEHLPSNIQIIRPSNHLTMDDLDHVHGTL